MREVCILTGPNGAGLSSARFVFEEVGYFVVENIPASLTKPLLDELSKYKIPPSKVLLLIPIREAEEVYKEVSRHSDFDVSLILITCSKSELLKRFTLTRHTHPSTVLQKISLENAIDNDLSYADALREYASVSINSTNLSLAALRSQLYKVLGSDKNKITLTFISYGLKYGAPKALDMSFDVRIIPNPYWVEGLRELNGTDEKVKDYLLSFKITKDLIENIEKYLDFYLVNLSVKERKDYVIGISCSGGQHRSTFVANELAKYFSEKFDTSVIHRDCPEINNG